MIALGNFLQAVAVVLHYLIVMYYWLLFIYVILSWASAQPGNPFVQFICTTTEPVLLKGRLLFRRLTGRDPVVGVLDLTPILVFILLLFIDSFVVGSLMDYAHELKLPAMRPAVF